MNADTDAQRFAQLAAQPVIELIEPRQHFFGAANRVGWAALRIGGIEAIQGHQTVAGELRIVSVARGQRLRHLVKKLVERKQCVVRELALGQTRRSAQVREQDGDQALAAFEAAAN